MWQPWVWGCGTDQPADALDRIAGGDHDAHLRRWGHEPAAWGHPVMLRFGHEMNGDWYPSRGLRVSTATRRATTPPRGATCTTSSRPRAPTTSPGSNPNVPYWGSTPLDGLYPGHSRVDVVALDGYNWGTSQAWSAWAAPEQLFGEGLAELRRVAPGKQIPVAEATSAEAGGSKPEWHRDLVAYLAAQPDVTGLVWFHLNKEVDWRIGSSQASADSLKQALAARPCP